MTYDKPKLILVRWHDACADIGWNDYDEDHIKEKSTVTSVGWLIAKNEHSILLAADSDVHNCEDSLESTYNRIMQIPIVCIDSVCALAVSGVARSTLDDLTSAPTNPAFDIVNPEIDATSDVVVETSSVKPIIRALPYRETFADGAKKLNDEAASNKFFDESDSAQ